MDINNSKVIVTGGLGFVGRNLIDELVQAGCKNIVIIDDCSNSKPDLAEGWEDIVTHLQQSVIESEWMKQLDDSDVIYHLACKTLLECNDNPVYDLEINAGSTLKILEYIKLLEQKPVFVYSSSACVYGLTPEYAIDESYSNTPTSQYGVSKLAGENYVQMYSKNFNLPTIVMRLSNVYGPWQTLNNPYCGVIGIFIDLAERGQPLTIVGDGTQSRDFTYASDVAQALVEIVNHKEAYGEIFNISYGKDTNINDLAKAVLLEVANVGTINTPQRVIDDIKHRCLNSDKLNHILTINRTSVIEGIKNTITWRKASIK